jgi:two-component system, sensor histidine kinase
VSKKKIMVVEDEAIVALDIQSKLEGKGYEVPAVVSTGEEAVQKAEETRPDMVLMDIQLEGEMDGVEAAALIRSQFEIPVVYLTAFSDEKTLQRAKISEPFGYLLKPFEERKLHTTIEITLYKHQIEKEKAHLEAQLHQAHKMEAIGRLTAGLAFNFTNMLQGIQGNLDLAIMDAPDSIKPFLDSADFDAQRAAQLVRQLMLFYQEESGDKEAVQLADLAAEVIDTCRQVFARKYARKIGIDLQCAPDLPPLQGDPSQLRQCITGLCTHAGDAIAELPANDARLPRIAISVESVHFSDAVPSATATEARGEHISVRITDNGVGMDAETQQHIFEPFLTTQDPKRATGLGLAMVYAIIREHHGWIECESQPESGSSFSVFLSVEDPEANEENPGREKAPELVGSEGSPFNSETLRGTEKVLLIADIDRYRNILAEMLERHDYEVLVGLDVRDGLNIFQFEKDTVDLVVLDLSTPGISGQDVLNQLHAIAPEVRILVATGYTVDNTPWQGASAILNKPFKTRPFLRTVRSLLAG